MNKKTGLTLGGVAVVAAIGIGAYVLRPNPAPQPAANVDETGAPIVQVAVPDQLSDAARRGKRAFEAKCATCHGRNAAGQAGVAPPLIHDYYKPSHHGDQAFLLAAQNGVRAHHWPFGNMPPVQGVTTASVRDIVAFVREIQRYNGIE